MPAGPRKALDKPRGDRIRYVRKYDRNQTSSFLRGEDFRYRGRDNYVNS
jgi:hypothetical protein